MISFEEAQQCIQANVPPPREEESFILSALNRVCARDIFSPVDLPLFDNSAMDGFLARSIDTVSATPEKPVALAVSGLIKAGDSAEGMELNPNKAYRIMTGAPLAAGADAVIVLEKAEVEKGILLIRKPLDKGANIRLRGEELKKGALALPKGAVIHPGTVGFLANMGLERVHVFQAPKISLIATGSELTPAGQFLAAGKIYDCNTPMLKAALEDLRLRPVFTRKLSDDPKSIKQVLAFSLKESDIVIVTGGVSIGDFDFVKPALQEAGVETLFWEVSQKPGKALFAGRAGQTLIFGLPGNPAAVFTGFYEYVYPAIRKFMGHANPFLRSDVMTPGHPLRADSAKTLFIKGKTAADGRVFALGHQQSHKLSTLSETDCLVVIPPSASKASADMPAKVTVHSLPYAMPEGCC